MRAGRLVQQGTVDEVWRAPADAETRPVPRLRHACSTATPPPRRELARRRRGRRRRRGAAPLGAAGRRRPARCAPSGRGRAGDARSRSGCVVDVDGRRASCTRSRPLGAATPARRATTSGWWSTSTRPAGSADRSPTVAQLPRLSLVYTPRLCPAGGRRRRHGRRWPSSRPRARQAAASTRTASSGPSWFRLPMLVLGAFVARRRAADAVALAAQAALRPPGEARSDRASTGPASASRWSCSGWSASTSPTSATGTSSTSCRWSTGDDDSTTASCTARPGAAVRPRAGDRCCTTLLGTDIAAHVLSYVYLLFLPMVPLALDRLAGLVAQHQLRLLVRHRAVPRLGARHASLLRAARPSGPASRTRRLYTDLDDTGVDRAAGLALVTRRQRRARRASSDAVQSRGRLRLPARRRSPCSSR